MRKNILDTTDQRMFDKQANEIYEEVLREGSELNQKFQSAMQAVTDAYVRAHSYYLEELKPEVSESLAPSINELLFSCIQKAVNGDPYNPGVYWVNNCKPRVDFSGEFVVPGGRYSYDNPDVIYRLIPISPSVKYVVRGTQNTPGGNSDYTYSLIVNPNSQNTVGYLDKSLLEVNSDGSYEIYIDSEPAAGRKNHILAEPAARFLFVRHTLADWSTEVPDSLSVELLGGSPEVIRTYDDIVNESLRNLEESVLTYAVGAMGLKTYQFNDVNTLSVPKQSASLGTLVTQASSFGHLDIADDEAFVLTVTPSDADYFVVPLSNAWIISVDPAEHQSSLNNKQSFANNDGTFTYVVSLYDPGVANWLDTAGLHENTIMVRWQNVNEASEPALHYQVVPLSELKNVLPPETTYLTASERAEVLKRRKEGYQRRVS